MSFIKKRWLFVSINTLRSENFNVIDIVVGSEENIDKWREGNH